MDRNVGQLNSVRIVPETVCNNIFPLMPRSLRQTKIRIFFFIKFLLLFSTGRVNIKDGVQIMCGPGSVVGIATGYGLDGPGIESRCGSEIFRTCPDRPWDPPSLLYDGYRVFPGVKPVGA